MHGSDGTRVAARSTMINTATIARSPFPLNGAYFKLLHLDDDQGKASFLLKIPVGCAAEIHRHLAAVEAFVVQGSFSYPGEGTVRAGDYDYEPGGMVHEPASEEDENLILLSSRRGRCKASIPTDRREGSSTTT